MAALALTAILGFAALSFGLFGSGLGTTAILLWMGVGALLIFVGVSLLSAKLVRPLATVLGWPAARLGGVAGHARARERPAATPSAPPRPRPR